MRKLICCISAIAVTMVMTVTTAFAGGCHGNNYNGARGVARATVPQYAACVTEGCNYTGVHYHNGRGYCAQYYAEGEAYQGYCELDGCAVAGYHEHDGVYFYGYDCGTANCVTSGYHAHGGGSHHGQWRNYRVAPVQ